MSFYQAGTVSVAAGSTAVTAFGTVFEQQVKPGDTLMAGAVQALVKSVESNNALTLFFPWAGPTLTDLPDYVISHTGTGWYSTKDLNESVTSLIQRVELHLAGGDGDGDPGGGDPGGGDPGGGSGDTEPPTSPTGLSAVSALDTGGRARVGWSWSANTSLGVLGYSLEVREVAGAALGNWVPQPDTQELHIDVTVPPGTVLDGRLRAFDKSLNYSPYSETVRVLASRDSTPPAIPTDITVMGVFNALFIKWTPAADADLEATEIYLSTSATAPQLTTAPTYVQPGNSTTIQNLPPGVDQYVSMRSRDTSGNRSAWTAPLLVVPRGLLTGEITAAVALIETAFIRSANIIEVDAVKIKAGSVLSSEVLVNNQTVGAIQAAAANPAAAINSGSTLIQPGKITVVGSWVMLGDTTKINGGMLSTNTVKASHIDTNSLAADAAFISNLKANIITVGNGSNLLGNSDFGADWTRWTLGQSNGSLSGTASFNFDANYTQAFAFSGKTAYVQQPNNNGVVYYDISQTCPVVGGERYELSFPYAAHRCQLQLIIQWLDVNSNVLGAPTVIMPRSDTAFRDQNVANALMFAIAPGSASGARIIIRKLATISGNSDSYLFFTRVMFCQALPTQTEQTPWSNTNTTQISPGYLQITGADYSALPVPGGQLGNPAGIINNNVTTINGGKITTGTLNANAIIANTLTADKIVGRTITADKLIVGGIITENLAQFAVTGGTYVEGAGDGSLSIATQGGILLLMYAFTTNDRVARTVRIFKNESLWQQFTLPSADGPFGASGTQYVPRQLVSFVADQSIGNGTYTYRVDTNNSGGNVRFNMAIIALKR